jgi:hypothetical protein
VTSSRDGQPAPARLTGPRHAAAIAVTAVAVVAVAATGCAAVPTGGPVQQVGTGLAGASQEQDYSQPIPVPPGSGWSPTEIVDGFLAASASFASNHAVAQEYLDPTARRSWRPGWAVTVVSTTPNASIVPAPKEVTGNSAAGQPDGNALARVEVTGQPVATLTGTGQYLVSSGPPTKPIYFSLIRVDGQWRIDDLPSSPLLLTEADFQHVYQARNLYYLAPSARTLVPDPVFAPLEATNTELATGLVNALLQDPAGWLNGAATTAFPAASSQIGQVKIIGPNATVNLGGRAAAASLGQREQMAAQLVWTLTSGPTGIHSVELEINGRPQQIMGNQYQLQQTYHAWVPAQPAASTLYFIGSSGAVEQMPGAGQPASGQPGHATAVVGEAGTATAPDLSSIAVSPDGRWLAGISADGSAVYTADLSHGGALRVWKSPSGSCTSLSWDSQGDLWIAAGGDLWLMQPGSDSASQVGLTALPAADNLTDFQVAPDGVRAAMIVTTPSGTQVQLAAITHSGPSAWAGQPVTLGAGIADPEALSWYGTDNVIVMSGGAAGGQLDEVPLNGGQPTAIAAAPGAVSMTATSPGQIGSSVALGLSGGQIMFSAGLGAFQPTHAVGRAPAYPG